VRLAEVYESRLNDTPRALAAYEAVLVRDPSHRGALEAVARLGELRGAWDRASAALSKLLELATDASGVPVALRLAKALGALDDDAGVASALRRALELEKSNEVVRDALRSLYEKRKSWSELAEMLVSDADLAEDAAGAEKSPAVLAGVVKALRRASEIYSGELSAPGLAVPHLERASALAPADRELLLALCDVYTASGRERAATEVLEKIIASFGGKRSKELGVFHHKLGRALASLGEKEAALAQFDLAFKIDPGAIGVLRELGVFSLASGDFERAQKTFRALLLQKLDDKSGITKAEVFFYLGEVLLKQGDKVKALPMYERAIENDASLATAKARIAELKG
jgi:tetratricopeptide (TPR) repeat protein